MHTYYKTRAYHAFRAMTYANDAVFAERRRNYAQADVWFARARECMSDAFAPAGDERLTPSAEYLADLAEYDEPHQPAFILGAF